MPSPSTPLLTYAPPPPWHRRRRFRRGIWLAAIGIAGLLVWHWRVPLIHRGQLIYWQWQCSNYTAPADRIVSFEGEPESAYRLASTNQGYRIRSEMFDKCVADQTIEAWNRLRAVAYESPSLSGSYKGSTVITGTRIVAGLPRSRQVINQVEQLWGPTLLFLHQRRSASGARRLVLVKFIKSYTAGGIWSFVGQSAETHVFGGLGPLKSTEELEIHTTFLGADGVYWQTIKTACFFAGQPDPHDASRFTMAYELDGQEGIIDGQLLDDGSVHLVIRNGPATQPNMRPDGPRPARPD